MGNNVAQLFYSHLNFSVLTVDWASPLSVKRSWGRAGWGVIRAISEKWGNYLPCQPTIAARLLWNGGKIEPYTIIIMVSVVVWIFRKILFGHFQYFWDKTTTWLSFGTTVILILILLTTYGKKVSLLLWPKCLIKLDTRRASALD
jgi:hypothetical protein